MSSSRIFASLLFLTLAQGATAIAAPGPSIETQSGFSIRPENASEMNLRDLIRFGEQGSLCFQGSSDDVINEVIERIGEQKSKYKINKIKRHAMYDSLVIKYEKRSNDAKDTLVIFNCGEL